ncbi:MAG: transposase, partial [Yoonia sp.]|nr:transposase [Yoonia sp.]
QLPPYCPHLNPIERLWDVLHQYVTHNRYYTNQKQFADAVLAFMRETIPHEWTKFREKVSDNFRVITHENFRILK